MTLNDTVWLKLAPSPIHGVGVFAIRDIPKGQSLHAYKDLEVYREGLEGILPEIRELIVQQYPIVELGSGYFNFPNAVMICYMNHSDEPNYDHINDIALRDIKKGEEVTERYPQDVKKLLDIE